jgi:hypothetical protein
MMHESGLTSRSEMATLGNLWAVFLTADVSLRRDLTLRWLSTGSAVLALDAGPETDKAQFGLTQQAGSTDESKVAWTHLAERDGYFEGTEMELF